MLGNATVLRTNSWHFFSILLTSLGVLLILGAASFYMFAELRRSQSDKYAAELTTEQRNSIWRVTESVRDSDRIAEVGESSQVSQFANLFPGGYMNPKYWSNPQFAGSEPFTAIGLDEGYIPVFAPGYGIDRGESGKPVRIRIPSIGLNETVGELEIISQGEGSRYEQPVRVVGHATGTANPGENGNGWYFGHQSNFGTNEGAVFMKLPDVFDNLQNDPQYVYIDTEDASFAYLITGTGVEDRETHRITDDDRAVVTLVTSWPPLIFDQRFLVFAELVAQRSFNEIQ